MRPRVQKGVSRTRSSPKQVLTPRYPILACQRPPRSPAWINRTKTTKSITTNLPIGPTLKPTDIQVGPHTRTKRRMDNPRLQHRPKRIRRTTSSAPLFGGQTYDTTRRRNITRLRNPLSPPIHPTPNTPTGPPRHRLLVMPVLQTTRVIHITPIKAPRVLRTTTKPTCASTKRTSRTPIWPTIYTQPIRPPRILLTIKLPTAKSRTPPQTIRPQPDQLWQTTKRLQTHHYTFYLL